jgi:hypothetical protein
MALASLRASPLLGNWRAEEVARFAKLSSFIELRKRPVRNLYPKESLHIKL